MNLHVTDHMGWQAKARERELLSEAHRMNEVTQALKSAPTLTLPRAPRVGWLTRLERLIPRATRPAS